MAVPTDGTTILSFLVRLVKTAPSFCSLSLEPLNVPYGEELSGSSGAGGENWYASGASSAAALLDNVLSSPCRTQENMLVSGPHD